MKKNFCNLAAFFFLLFVLTSASFAYAGADLVMTGLTAPSGTVNGTFDVTSTVMNQGGVNASPFSVGFYLSSDNTVTTPAIYL